MADTPTGWRPWAVGTARALLLAVLAVVVPFLIEALSSEQVPTEWQVYLPLILFVLRAIEGGMDTRWSGDRQAKLLKGGRL